MRAGPVHGYAWVPRDPNGSAAAKDVFGGRALLDLEKLISTPEPFIQGVILSLCQNNFHQQSMHLYLREVTQASDTTES